jgi:hypothetical protein
MDSDYLGFINFIKAIGHDRLVGRPTLPLSGRLEACGKQIAGGGLSTEGAC